MIDDAVGRVFEVAVRCRVERRRGMRGNDVAEAKESSWALVGAIAVTNQRNEEEQSERKGARKA